AGSIASMKAPDKAEQLYHELLTLVRMWSVDNMEPLLQALQENARFLIGQRDRRGEAPAAIERYREALLTARGAVNEMMEQVIQLRIELARASGAPADAVQSAEELLTFQESLSGPASVRYMHALQNAAHVYETSGYPERALALQRQIVAIADLCLGAKRMTSAWTTAMALLLATEILGAGRTGR